MPRRKNTSKPKTVKKWVRKTNWLELPTDITANILHRLGPIEILESAQKVCTSWRQICKDPAMWRVIDMHNSGPLMYPYDLEKMCMHAVDRSQGQLVEINIEYFGTDHLMHYIANSNSASQLRCLQISFCYDNIYGSWSEFFKKAPLLEEIALTYTDISEEAIADAGQYCPMLKSFKYNDTGSWSEWSEEDCSVEESFADDTIRAVAKSMSQLRHLQLIGNKMTNEGLQAIIDGCSQLEFLDLRRCFNLNLKHLNLKQGLIKTCKDRIKDLRLPGDSMKDFKFVCDDDYHMMLDDDDDDDDYDDDSDYGELCDSDSPDQTVSEEDMFHDHNPCGLSSFLQLIAAVEAVEIEDSSDSD